MRDHGFLFRTRVATRQEVWRSMVSHVVGKRVLYLEFGVAYGGSIRWWARELEHSSSAFHGFDSFEGLPEQSGPWHKRQFDAAGRIPDIADSRVTFFKGLFEQTLPGYCLPDYDVIVINMDADLYSSTSYVLNHLRIHIKPGTLIYFDEMNHVDHEARAFHEFMDSSRLRFRAFCADRTLAHACFECVGLRSDNLFPKHPELTSCV
jgi:O-methyltransferase